MSFLPTRTNTQEIRSAADRSHGATHTSSLVPHEVIEKIKSTDLSSIKPILLGSSRPKPVYLFTADGKSTTSKMEARYMVDKSMDNIEFARLQEVESHGLTIPTMYGVHPNHEKGGTGYQIIQWLPSQTTVSKTLETGIRNALKNAERNKKPFQKERWQKALQYVDVLISRGFDSPDLQFMIDDTGTIYMMDFDKNNPPSFNPKPSEKLINFRKFLDEVIAKEGVLDEPEPTDSDSD